jgi:WD40 repeat protein
VVLADGRRALSGSGHKTLRLWDLETGVELRRLEGHEGWVSSLVVMADGRLAPSDPAIGRCGCGISRPVLNCAAS